MIEIFFYPSVKDEMVLKGDEVYYFFLLILLRVTGTYLFSVLIEVYLSCNNSVDKSAYHKN